MQLRLVNADAPILRRKAIRCTKTNVPLGLEQAMIEFAASLKALGLAAPQVDYGLRLIVVVGSAWGNYIIMRNPRIVKAYRHYNIAVEGCLSLPGKLYNVQRARTIKVKHQGGEQVYTDGLARVIQHEIDHLDGILISDRGTPVEASNGQ